LEKEGSLKKDKEMKVLSEEKRNNLVFIDEAKKQRK
jgi:hypothetical protein